MSILSTLSPCGANLDELLEELYDASHELYGFGNMSCAAYDTALMSLVGKPTEDGGRDFLFPESLQYLIDTQEPSGGWQTAASQADGVVNTMGALLSLSRHSQMSGVDKYKTQVDNAKAYLDKQLNEWDVATSCNVGFEVLVPLYINLLEGDGFTFSFPRRDTLFALKARKMDKLKINLLYGNLDLSIVHSLEALTGQLDFNRVAHRKTLGSMMGSPSATAAYLMHCSEWDSESEAYLRYVFKAGPGKGKGGVPSAFPSHIFELTWTVTTLLETKACTKDHEKLVTAKSILLDAYGKGNGLVGFAPSMPADADDTAQCITALHQLGHPVSAESLVKAFYTGTHFKTYNLERDPSFSANCNAVTALAHSLEGPTHFKEEIQKALEFLFKTWWETGGDIHDKWNLSDIYSTMLMARACSHVIREMETELPQGLVEEALLSMSQALNRILSLQQSNGSWFQSREQTSYAVLALRYITSFAFARALESDIEASISRVREYFTAEADKEWSVEYLWVEKVSYGIPVLSKIYAHAASVSTAMGYQSCQNSSTSPEKIQQQFSLFSKLPLLKDVPGWQIKAYLLESIFFQPKLRSAIPSIFPRTGMRKETYLTFIPFTWLATDLRLPPQILLDMMVVSAQIYQLDEYTEGVVGALPINDILKVKSAVSSALASAASDESMRPCDFITRSSTYAEIEKILVHFYGAILHHPRVLQNRDTHTRRMLSTTVQEFISASLKQAEDSKRVSIPESEASTDRTATPSLHRWLHTTGADTTGGPFAFYFFISILGAELASARVAFVAEDISRLISTTCRMYNDVGSAARDLLEKNVNALDFQEFGGRGVEGKEELLKMAEYKNRALLLALDEFRGLVDEKVARAAKGFCDVTDMYGQLYVLKDMSPSVKKHAVGASGDVIKGKPTEGEVIKQEVDVEVPAVPVDSTETAELD